MRAGVLLIIASGCSFTPSDGAIVAPEADAAVPVMTDDAPPPPPDAVVFSPALCPETYDRTVPGHPDSRYRFLPEHAPFATHHASCNADHPGWTHLIVLDDMAEAMAAGQIDPQDFAFVGAVQDSGQATPILGWRLFTGGAPTTGWSPSNTQPDDGGDHVEDGQESLAMVASTGNMHDAAGVTPHAAACECDGLPIDPAVAAMIP